MKKIFIPLLLTVTTFAASITYADTANVTQAEMVKNKGITTTTSQANAENNAQTNTLIHFYAEPNSSSKIISTYNVKQATNNHYLIPIFQKDGWIKVGDPTNGDVGWINKEQYQKAMNTAIHESLQTVYIEQIDNAAQGKPSEITVYQNGKKLTGEEAKAIYTKIEKQQQQMQQSMQAFQTRMNNWMDQNMQMANVPMPTFPLMQPVIIVENHSSTDTNTTPKTAKPTVPLQTTIAPETKK